MVDDKIRFTFVRTNVYTRWECHVCGGATEKVGVLCEVAEGGCKGMRVCEQCLEAGQDKIDERLQAQIAVLEDRVTDLRNLVGCLVVPTFAEWQAAMADDEAEWRKSYVAAGGEIPVSEVGSDEEVPF